MQQTHINQATQTNDAIKLNIFSNCGSVFVAWDTNKDDKMPMINKAYANFIILVLKYKWVVVSFAIALLYVNLL